METFGNVILDSMHHFCFEWSKFKFKFQKWLDLDLCPFLLNVSIAHNPINVLLFTLGRVILTFRRRLKDSQVPTSQLVDKVAKDLTVTAIIVAIIFVITIGYDLNYYFLGYVGLVEYKLNEPIQKVSYSLKWTSSKKACMLNLHYFRYLHKKSYNGGDYGEYNGFGFVEISTTLSTHRAFFFEIDSFQS